MTDRIAIRRAQLGGSDTRALADCVEGGASVGFMVPLHRSRVEAFWADALESASSS